MDKKLLKKYAVASHEFLFTGIKDALQRLLELDLDNQELENLKIEIRAQTLPEVAGKIAYTWFNRITLLRLLEVRGWLGEVTNNKKIVWQDFNSVFQIIKTASRKLPQLFSNSYVADDFINLIIPEEKEKIFQSFVLGLLNLPSENFMQVEMLGWTYQYYNSAEKTYYIKLKKAYQKSTIPIVTRIFTPKFIVEFLVQNSLGRFLIEHQILKHQKLWKFFLRQNSKEQKEKLEPSEIKFIDPCCGSGHMLIYAFEIFMEAYKENGFSKNEAVKQILQYNIFGLDVDDFAVQIARAALMIKAREYCKSFFENLPSELKLNIFAIPESNIFGKSFISALPSGVVKDEALELFQLFDNAKEIGSLIKPRKKTYANLENYLLSHCQQYKFLENALSVYNILSAEYNIVCTNPPYINTLSMDKYLKHFIVDKYENYRRDTFACFMKRCTDFTSVDGYFAMMTPQVWLTTVSFIKLREFILLETRLISVVKLAPETFFGEAAVDVALFVAEKPKTPNFQTAFIQLEDKGGLDIAARELMTTLNESNSEKIFLKNQEIFQNLPNQILAFTTPAKILRIIKDTPALETSAKPRQGIITGNNEKYLRYWFEIHETNKNWVPHNKGGEFRKWYGNRDFVINWQDGGKALKEHKDGYQKLSRLQNLEYNFQPAVSWSSVTSGDLSARFYDETFTFNVAGPGCFAPPSLRKYLLGFLNSVVANEFVRIFSPTMNYNVGDIAKVPFIIDRKHQAEIDRLVDENITLAKEDWDMFESSSDFKIHPLLELKISQNSQVNLLDSFNLWNETCQKRFKKLKKNEERLNQIFLQIYGLENVFPYEVPDDKISLHLINEKTAAKSFLSFFLGVVFGRFKANNLNCQANNILFTYDDRIIEELKTFLTKTCGTENLENNLIWLTDALGRAVGQTTEDIIKSYFENNFFFDHLKTYKNTPIYWQVDSGPTSALKGLFYVHNFSVKKLKDELLTEITKRQNGLLDDLGQFEAQKGTIIWPTERQRIEKLQESAIAKLRELNDFYQKVVSLNQTEIKLDFDLGIQKNYAKLSSILTELKPSRYFRKKQQILAQKP